MTYSLGTSGGVQVPSVKAKFLGLQLVVCRLLVLVRVVVACGPSSPNEFSRGNTPTSERSSGGTLDWWLRGFYKRKGWIF